MHFVQCLKSKHLLFGIIKYYCWHHEVIAESLFRVLTDLVSLCGYKPQPAHPEQYFCHYTNTITFCRDSFIVLNLNLLIKILIFLSSRQINSTGVDKWTLKGSMKLFITSVISGLAVLNIAGGPWGGGGGGGKQQETDRPDRNCFISLMSTVTGRRMKSDSWEMGCSTILQNLSVFTTACVMLDASMLQYEQKVSFHQERN